MSHNRHSCEEQDDENNQDNEGEDLMAWIESHQSLCHHYKTSRLMRRLSISRREAIGLLQMVWWWSLDNAPDGDLSHVEREDLANAAEWDDPDQLFDALASAGFIDVSEGVCEIHDWWDFAGKLVERRRTDAERKRTAARARKDALPPRTCTDESAPYNISSNGTPSDIQRSTNGDPSGDRTYRTQPYPTQPCMTDEEANENGKSPVTTGHGDGVSPRSDLFDDLVPDVDLREEARWIAALLVPEVPTDAQCERIARVILDNPRTKVYDIALDYKIWNDEQRESGKGHKDLLRGWTNQMPKKAGWDKYLRPPVRVVPRPIEEVSEEDREIWRRRQEADRARGRERLAEYHASLTRGEDRHAS